MNDFLMSVAPTIASALLGPLGGIAVAGLGKIFGIDGATQKDITKAITDGKITPEQLAEIRKLEMQFQQHEQDLKFQYSELEFKDRDSARNLAITTHSVTPSLLTWLVVLLVLLAEGMLLFNQVPKGVDPIIIGRVLGTMDSALIMVLSFWFGSNSTSSRKTELLAQASLPK